MDDAGIYSVLVGGAVVAIYTEGLYRSGDLDIVPDDFQRKKLGHTLEGLGFRTGKGRYYEHPLCKHLVVEFPKGPVELGEEHPVIADEIEYQGKTIRLLSPTDCVKDRLASYIHWGTRDCFDQAVLVCQRQSERVDLENLRKWCDSEGGSYAYEELLKQLAGLESE
ncbi:hypothetical protein [Oceaniferula marina]|uniref:hypothetical protein n=1 Tax=Oceaniferula marina TaxID=2748318 RepID=UPI001D05A82F|nr:hypothetical protein [Oceaniferula marina]